MLILQCKIKLGMRTTLVCDRTTLIFVITAAIVLFGNQFHSRQFAATIVEVYMHTNRQNAVECNNEYGDGSFHYRAQN